MLTECKNLYKSYGAKAALYGVDLNIESGRIIGLLGPNGSGKTTLIKILAGLLTPTSGTALVDGMPIGVETKRIVSYLPERTYLNEWMTACQAINYFADFYADFGRDRAYDMLARLNIDPADRLKTMSKGTREKVQLILVMSRAARLYLLDEPIGGVDPAARDYILRTILTNYSENSSIIISTHLISDVENILDEAVFLKYGRVTLHMPVDDIRQQYGKSVDELFREIFSY